MTNCICHYCKTQILSERKERRVNSKNGFFAFSTRTASKFERLAWTNQHGKVLLVRKKLQSFIDTPNVEFLNQQRKVVQVELSTADLWNRLDAKWVADNMYQKPSLDLSNAGYFTEMPKQNAPRIPQGYLYLTEYVDRNVMTWCPCTNSKTPPVPIRTQRRTKALSKESATLLRRAGVLCQSNQGIKFITLSYAKPLCQRQAKKHLDNFIKALTRYAPGSDWFWVAELTKKGLIHYHVSSTATWIAVDWLRNTWQRITGDERLQPDIQNVRNPANYMAKYMAKDSKLLEPAWIVGKRCGFSRNLRNKLKPESGCRIPATWDEAANLLAQSVPADADFFTTKTGVIIHK